MVLIKTLVISDIHGCLAQFDDLLKLAEYNPDKDKLILLGDYIDRGLRSKDVVNKVRQLKKDYGVIALKGNHDQMMVNAFRLGEDGLWLNNGGVTTVQSYVGSDLFDEGFDWSVYLRAKKLMSENFMDHIDFLENLSLFHEDDKHIFVHAGINPLYPDWKKQPESDFYWIRDSFYKNGTNLKKTVVFGHTPTEYLHGVSDVWFGDRKIGIDGACAYGRQLNCLEIREEGFRTFKILKNERR